VTPYLEWAKKRPSPRFDLAGSNILPFSIDDLPGARDALTVDGANEYGYAPLIEAIAGHCGVSPAQVTTAQGASGANFLACAALLQPGDEVLVETPGYDPLFGAPRLLSAHVKHFVRDFADGFALDPDRVRSAMTPRTRLIILTSPHNPSGVIADSAALAEVGRMAQANHAHVLIDEVYMDAASVPAGPRVSRGPASAIRGDAFICTNSLTKSYGLYGLRCGWILSSPEVAERIRRTRDMVDGGGSIVTERLATLAFAHIARLQARTEALLSSNRPLVREFLASRRAELDWIPSDGTVVFPRLGGVDDTSAFAEHLLARYETAVVPGRFFQAPPHMRIGFGCATDALQGGLEALGAALDELRVGVKP
jgi:aspartate/methionine/tyrosine aminotransferase